MNQTEKSTPQLDDLFSNPEPWESWEHKLVWGSIIVAIVSLGILGILINIFLLK